MSLGGGGGAIRVFHNRPTGEASEAISVAGRRTERLCRKRQTADDQMPDDNPVQEARELWQKMLHPDLSKGKSSIVVR